MARRLQQTAHDYVVIALSPALIMTLVGSLVFFLITVFYQGAFPARLHWVMACFVFAAVLIGRISIEEGLERAMPFGAALAIVVGIAANRFVEYQGSWVDQMGWLVNWSLIGVIWWCAHKLTWDCTVIDDSQDASGEGLMQIAGLEKPASTELDAALSPQPIDIEGTTSRHVPAGWWQRYVEHQHRPHAPGVWVVYFSLAALPIFGFGQWFIPVESTGARRYVFWLLCVYVASGLGLLVTTSFLGLRRYLRQRRVEMPAIMSNLWLGTGAAIIAALLLAAMLLPRPSAEYAISELPFSVGSPGGAKSSRFAPDPSDAPDDGRQGQGQAFKSEEQVARDDADGPSQSGLRRDSDDEPVDGGRAQQPATEREPDAEKQPGEASGNQRSDGQPGAARSGENPSNSSGPEQQGGQAKASQKIQDSRQQQAKDSRAERIERMNRELAARQNRKQEPPPEEPPPDEAQKNDDARDEPADAQQPDRAGENQQRQTVQTPPEVDQEEQREASGKTASSSTPRIAPPPTPPVPPLGWAAGMLKWVFYAAFALAVCYFVWRYWGDVLAALRDFWAGLWGGRKSVKVRGDEPVAIQIPPASFHSFADPFATGVAGRYPLAELVRYSFEAFEAWSREHGCERKADQTPHELARDVAKLNAPMAADARNLAELYSRAAFAEGELPEGAREQLAHAWQSMRGLAQELR